MIKLILIGVSVLLMTIFLGLVILQIRNRQNIAQIQHMLRSEPMQQRFTKELIAELPDPVQRYFLHAIAPETPLATSVRLIMQGQFRLSPEKPWMLMQAEETLTPTGFIWSAKIGSGLSQFQGSDYYFDRAGRMQFSILGLVPIVNVQNPDTARSAIGRLVAELMWLPSALLPQQGVQWQAIDDHTIQAHLRVDDEPVTLTFVIDSKGKLLEGSTLRWGDRTEDGSWKHIPMGGKCYAERTFDGFTIPSQVGVGWWFGSEQYFEFFQATVKQAEF
ncbi:MAG: hypothetical protein HY785_28915 [Oscillatoriophycideae cyanobacterium NC_groundwater_1537_Pr4_S-0.65um_50_18]|nr:hypothetical protein [Oscillatoriophycideae cyanobacterium NC_groundwater_1537_Pr4_S-0.65um_50_18]